MNLIKRLFKKTHDEPDAPVSPPLKPREMIADPPRLIGKKCRAISRRLQKIIR